MAAKEAKIEKDCGSRLPYHTRISLVGNKGSLGAMVELSLCDLKVIGSRHGNSLLQKCKGMQNGMLLGWHQSDDEENSAWMLETGATRHVTGFRCLLNNYAEVPEGSQLYLGNASTANVVGRGDVKLNFVQGRSLTLKNVLHAPDVKRNVVSGSLLAENGFKLVFQSDEVTITKNGSLVGKGSVTNGSFKLRLLNGVST